MGKKLSEMSLEELWQLFPIYLTEHNDIWEEYYQEMESILKQKLSECAVVRISHIGSTAIEKIWAKPIIDILVEISAKENMRLVAEHIVNCEFIKMCESENRMSFNYGYTENGFAEKVYHLHLRYEGDHDELYFRDYLNDYPDVAKEYEQLKLKLWHQYEHDRDAYTNAKTELVKKYTEIARPIYEERY